MNINTGIVYPKEHPFPSSNVCLLGAEIHEKAVKRTGDNIRDLTAKMCLPKGRAVDSLQWDAVLAPCLRDACVDVLITDLPFGKRSGSKADNRVLYPRTLLSMARVVRPVTGTGI
jgi:tRNA G10  N-methylase Trm11